MIEEWRPVLGSEGAYEVSSFGQVRSLDRHITYLRNGVTSGRTLRGRVLKQQRDRYGYLRVAIGGRMRKVHTLVVEAFLGPRPPGMEVCHADGSRDNNHISNLRYDTRAGNAADALKHGTVRTPNAGTEHHCGKGHELTPENTIQSFSHGRPHRLCRTCRRASYRAYRLRKAAAS